MIERGSVVNNSERLVRELFAFSNQLHQKVARSHHTHSSYVGRGRILYLLAQHDYVYQNQLAKLAKIKPGSLTQILEKMEKEGLIVRKRDQHDKRLVYVFLSPAGKKQVTRNEQYHRDFQQYVTGTLTEDEMKQFTATLEKIQERLNEYVDRLQKKKGDEDK